MNTIFPCISKGFDLLWFSCDLVKLAILHVSASGGPLEVRVELNAVWWVNINALHFATQSFTFG